MPNRQLSSDELALANELLDSVRTELNRLAGGDKDLLFAFRRKVAKELVYDERKKPMVRRALKKRMRALQNNLCPLCRETLPERYCVLDRFNAVDEYVESNVRLICEPCNRRVQEERCFT
jgi:UTP:GlnB (protein PII) uridylyltransferase